MVSFWFPCGFLLVSFAIPIRFVLVSSRYVVPLDCYFLMVSFWFLLGLLLVSFGSLFGLQARVQVQVPGLNPKMIPGTILG